MATDEIPISLTAGIDYAVSIPVIDSAGAAKDVSSWTFESDVRTDRTLTASELATFAIDMTDAATGVVVMSLTGVQTQAVHDALLADTATRGNDGIYDVKVTVSGKTSILFGGPVMTKQAVTRT